MCYGLIMPTNPIGKGTSNVSVNMPADLVERIDKLRKEGQSRSSYCRAIIVDAVQQRLTVREERVSYVERPLPEQGNVPEPAEGPPAATGATTPTTCQRKTKRQGKNKQACG